MSILLTQFHKKNELREEEKARCLSEWMDTYQNLIFSICCKITGDYFAAEDLTQETFLAAYRNINGFDMVNEKAWLCRIATNKSLDYIRNSRNRAVIKEEDFFLRLINPGHSPEELCLEEEIKVRLRHYCEKLKPPYNKIAIEVYCNEKRPEEIADQTNKNLKTVQTQIYRAREMLRKLYAKEAGYDR